MKSEYPPSHGAVSEPIVGQWFNTDAPPTLSALRGKRVAIEALQMLCPGCVSHGLPQAARVRAAFPRRRWRSSARTTAPDSPDT